MNKNRVIKYLIALVVVVTGFIGSQKTFAAGIGFTVDPIFSSNQIDKSKEFYYLKTIPGGEQVIEVDITSTQEEPINILITPQNAWTQSNGQMAYSDDLGKIDESLINPLTSMLELENQEVLLDKFETKRIKIKLRAPEEHYEGIKAGALTFSIAEDDKNGKAGVGTDYAVRIGVMTSEAGDTYSDGKELLLKSAKATVINSHKLVVGRLQNPEPKMLINVGLQGTITDEKTGKVIKTKKMDNVTLAPNSYFDYEFDWGIDTMPAGDFIMTIKGENGVSSWDLTQKFSISGEQAKKVNDASAFKIVTDTWIKILTIVLGVITLLSSVIVFVRLGRRNNEWKKLQIKRKKKRGKGRRR